MPVSEVREMHADPGLRWQCACTKAQAPGTNARVLTRARAHTRRLTGKETFQHVQEDGLTDKRTDTTIDTDMEADGPKSEANKPGN
jgi:hypothetical protein